MMMAKLKIDIDIPCIIVPKDTGIIYCNQVGGYACHQLEVEGYIIPLAETYYRRVHGEEKANSKNPYWNKYKVQEHFDKLFAPLEKGTKYNGHGYKGIDESDAEYIEHIFKDDYFLTLKVDRDMLKESEEAKVFVIITLEQYNALYERIEPLQVNGILTWNNSD